MNKRNCLLVLMVFSCFFVYGQDKNFIDQPYIETSAHVDTLVTPDRIYINILIAEKDTKGKTSVEEQEKEMEAAFKKLGIDTKKDLTLNDLASNFKKYFLKQQDVLKSKSYTLLVRDAQMAGRVIVALEDIEISNVNIDRTEFARIEELKMHLKSMAVHKANQQAEFMAAPLKQIVGPAIYISDRSNIMNSYQSMPMEIRLRGNSSAKKEVYQPADIEFEKIKVENVVEVKFKLGQ